MESATSWCAGRAVHNGRAVHSEGVAVASVGGQGAAAAMAGQGAFGRTALELLKEVAYCEPGHLPRHNDTAIKEVLLQVRRARPAALSRRSAAPEFCVRHPGALAPRPADPLSLGGDTVPL